MHKTLKTLPLLLLLSGCASSFLDKAQGSLSYQEAVSLGSHNSVGKTVLVGGPIISVQYSQNTTNLEIINASTNSDGVPTRNGDSRQRAIIIIPEIVPENQLQNVRISAYGPIREIGEFKQYGQAHVIMLDATNYRIWRTAKPMFDPSNKPRYGLMYELNN